MARRRTRFEDTEVKITMSRKYSDHPLCKQLAVLRDEEALKDVEVVFGVSGRVERMSGFLLSLLSPVWHRTLVHAFSNGRALRMNIEEDEAEALKAVVTLGCGRREQVMTRGMDGLLEVGRVAEKYQVDEVKRAVEKEVLRHLNLESCAELLTECESIGLRQVEGACRKMMLERFEELTMTKRFMGMGEEMLRSLLEDEGLECSREESVFEGLVQWMKWPDGSLVRGEGLLEVIRFPVMSEDYLNTSARHALEGSEVLDRLVLEALKLKVVPVGERRMHMKYLGAKALRARLGRGVQWGEYEKGHRGAWRLAAPASAILSLADGGAWVAGGAQNGRIIVWNKASCEKERTLTGHTDEVCALAVYQGWLVSGSFDHHIRVWDVSNWECVRTLVHTSCVCALGVVDRLLLSSAQGEDLRVWMLDGAPSAWRCESTLALHGDGALCVVCWGSKAVSGCESGMIRVWEVSTGEWERTLQGHTQKVTALIAEERRLISTSWDGSVREWCLESWACVRMVQVYHVESPQYIKCLAVSGGKLVGGSDSEIGKPEGELVVWDRNTWEEVHRLEQPEAEGVYSLLAMDGELWAGVDLEMRVWGR